LGSFPFGKHLVHFDKEGLMAHYWVNPTSPVAFHIFGFPFHWYSLAYMIAFVTATPLMMRAVRKYGFVVELGAVGTFAGWLAAGVMLGGRLGEALIYNHALLNPLHFFSPYEPGMSSHGGIVGVTLATAWFARKFRQNIRGLGDLVCFIAPLGLFLGRLGNFVNSEMLGAVSQVPWAVVYPLVDNLPRHPVQLYQALLEGPVLFGIMAFVARRWHRPGTVAMTFLAAYAVLRLFSENFREVNPGYLGYHAGLTDGQLLSMGMVVAAAAVGYFIAKRPPERPVHA
jgi:phosphatidylglycerol:prolipoprotein diacylglycerol transferase